MLNLMMVHDYGDCDEYLMSTMGSIYIESKYTCQDTYPYVRNRHACIAVWLMLFMCNCVYL